ncbi:MAG: DUF1365 domain-containing protein [Kofleriaceae bacterium]|nr:DUF1365 domain-containing protein [Kofleriaceae bacterium]
MTRSALYRGTLVHTRRDHLAHRTFRYPVYTAVLDLTELPALDRELRLFSHRRRNLFSFYEADYEGGADLSASLARVRTTHALPTPAITRLVTNLRVAGYVFNPVSFFLDYDSAGALTAVIAEVNNTYGGRYRYVLGAAHRLPGPRVGFRHRRELFVSPFLHGPREYEFWFDAPLDGDRLAITMHVDTPAGERNFHATLAGTRSALSDRVLAAAALRYPLMTAQVIGLIHLEAMKLRLAGVPYRRPGPDHRPLDD